MLGNGEKLSDVICGDEGEWHVYAGWTQLMADKNNNN